MFEIAGTSNNTVGLCTVLCSASARVSKRVPGAYICCYKEERKKKKGKGKIIICRIHECLGTNGVALADVLCIQALHAI
jgi:hypothetical protein